jgi:cell division septation protein DedD
MPATLSPNKKGNEMMRWALMFLLAANVGFFIWHQFKEAPPRSLATTPESQGHRERAERLKLLSESKSAAVPRVDDVTLVAATEPPARQGSLCWLLGPLPEEVTAKQILMRFQSQGVPAELQQIKLITGLDYLLYIGPFVSRAESLAKLRKLHEAGVDSFVITRGSLTEAIALGLFASRSEAELAGDAFENEQGGYQTQVRENERTGVQLWLVVPTVVADSLNVSFWDELDMDFGELERKQKWCNTIASVDSIE